MRKSSCPYMNRDFVDRESVQARKPERHVQK